MNENDVSLGFFFLAWTDGEFKFFFSMYKKKRLQFKYKNLQKNQFCLHISWYLGSPVPLPPPQPQFIN